MDNNIKTFRNSHKIASPVEMNENLVKNSNHAFIYMVECTLATVAHMALLKKKSVNEFKRQVSIANFGISKIKEFNLQVPIDSRVYEVFASDTQKVEDWLKRFR
jgi:hypothetical protein